MTHTARVVSISTGTPPNEDWRSYPASLAVTVEPFGDDRWQVFWIRADGPVPVVGDGIEYDAHHAWWDGARVKKTLTRDP